MNEKLFDKIYGCWLGKCIGGSAGAAVEGYKKYIDRSFLETMRPDLPNDDLDLQLLWFDVLREKGLALTADDLADAWKKRCWYPFSEYGIFLKNYDRGIHPPLSGSHENPLFHDGEGSPIRSEIWATIFPGNPAMAARYAEMDSSLDHSGDALAIEQFLAAAESDAFVHDDMWGIIGRALPFLKKGSRAYACADLVIKSAPTGDWKSIREQVLQSFGHNDFTNSVTNLGLVLNALLCCGGSMEKAIDICYRSGYDTDCTCATAAAFLGILHGAKAIPRKLTDLVGDSFVCGINIKNPNRSIRRLAEEVCAFAENPFMGTPASSTIEISYRGDPAIGPKMDCNLLFTLRNHSDRSGNGLVRILDVPEGWILQWTGREVSVPAHGVLELPLKASLSEAVRTLRDKNLLRVEWNGTSKRFGIIGARVWSVRGAYFEALDKPLPAGFPPPHGEGSILPTTECMVNNTAFLSKSYGEERDVRTLVVAPTARIPIDENYPWFIGQGLWYAESTLISEEERDVWMVVGNNDGFSIRLNGKNVLEEDAIRLWTPYNNAAIVHLRKGRNKLRITLLRRTEHLKFSLDWRFYEGSHYHRKPYITDFACSW